MILEIICVLLGLSSCMMETGFTSRYDPTPMIATIEYRQGVGEIPEDLSMYDGFVAVSDCDKIGLEIYAMPEGGRRFERFLIVDCAGGQSTYRWMVDNKILGEFDYDTAVRWGAVDGGVPVVVVYEIDDKA